MTELGFATRDAFEAWKDRLRNPEVSAEIRQDEKKFLNSEKTTMWVVDEHACDYGGRSGA